MSSLLNAPPKRVRSRAPDIIPPQHPSIRRLRIRRLRTFRLLHLLHRLAGLTLCIFTTLHLVNHLFALVSVQQHIKAMELLRLVYRHPLGETVVLAALTVQVPTGIALVRRKVWRGLPLAERARIASGAYLALFLVVHVSAVMVGRYVLHLDTNFYFASARLRGSLWLCFVVYYELSVIAVFTHVASVHYQYVRSRSTFRSAQTQALVIAGVGVALAILIVLAFSGVLYDITFPAVY